MAELRSKGVLKLVCFDFCNVFIFQIYICLIILVNIWEKFPKSLKSMKLSGSRRFWIWKIFVWLWSFFYVFSTVCFHVAELMSPAGKMVSRENGPSFTRQATWALLLNWIMFIIIYLLSRIMWMGAIIYIKCSRRNLSSTAKVNGILPTILKIKTQKKNKI